MQCTVYLQLDFIVVSTSLRLYFIISLQNAELTPEKTPSQVFCCEICKILRTRILKNICEQLLLERLLNACSSLNIVLVSTELLKTVTFQLCCFPVNLFHIVWKHFWPE